MEESSSGDSQLSFPSELLYSSPPRHLAGVNISEILTGLTSSRGRHKSIRLFKLQQRNYPGTLINSKKLNPRAPAPLLLLLTLLNQFFPVTQTLIRNHLARIPILIVTTLLNLT